MKGLYDAFGARIHLVDVLVRQGHPGPGAPPYLDFDEKRHDATRYRREDHIPWPVLVDDLDGQVHRSYGALPDPSFLIGTDGRVAFVSYWTHVPTLRAAVIQVLAAGGAATLGEQRAPRGTAALTRGWPAIERGLPQSARDLDAAVPGSTVVLRLGYLMASLMASLPHPSPPLIRGVATGLAGAALVAVVARRLTVAT